MNVRFLFLHLDRTFDLVLSERRLPRDCRVSSERAANMISSLVMFTVILTVNHHYLLQHL